MTADKLEAMLSKISDLRENLRRQWVQVMRFDDEPIPPELGEIRAAIIADDSWATSVEQRIRRAIVRRQAIDSMDAGMVDLIARYRPPSWN